MAQHDYVIANGTGAAVRSDLNGSLAAIVSNNSGATEPGTMYAYQWWADTTTGLLKQRNAANNAWITIGTLASANLGLLSLAGGTMTGVLAVTAGTAALPGIAVSGDLNTGLFSPGADTLALVTGGTNRVHVTSGGLVGIATSSPSSVLDVASSNSGITLTNTGASNKQWRLGGSSAGSFVITEAGVDDRLTIDSSGRVGIGTTSPGSYNVNADDLVIATSGNTGITIASSTTGLGQIAFADGTTTTDAYRGLFQYDHSSNAMVIYTDATERARIDSSGRLLVGTSSARTAAAYGAAGFQVESTYFANSSFSAINNQATSDGSALMLGKSRGTSNGSTTIVQSGDTTGYISFQGADGTNLKETASIFSVVDGTPGANDMPGRLVFCTTADGASSPTERMRINSSGQPLFQCTSSTTVGSHTGASNVSTFNFSGITLTQYSVSAGFYYDRLNFTNSQYFVVNSSGTGVYLGNGATSWTAYSDERLKTNIVELDGAAAWNHCKTARAVTFNWRPENYPNNQKIGFIAQDWEASYPEVITTTNETIDGVETPKGMQYTETIPVLMAALKEAIAKIETLEARLTAAGIE